MRTHIDFPLTHFPVCLHTFPTSGTTISLALPSRLIETSASVFFLPTNPLFPCQGSKTGLETHSISLHDKSKTDFYFFADKFAYFRNSSFICIRLNHLLNIKKLLPIETLLLLKEKKKEWRV